MTDRGLTVNGVRAVFVRVTVRIRAFVAFAEKYAAASLFALSSGDPRAGGPRRSATSKSPGTCASRRRARGDARIVVSIEVGDGREHDGQGDDHGGGVSTTRVGRPCRNGTRPWRWFAVKGLRSRSRRGTRERERDAARDVDHPAHPRGSSNHRARPRGSRLRRARRDPSSFPRPTYPRRRSSRTLPSAIFPGKKYLPSFGARADRLHASSGANAR